MLKPVVAAAVLAIAGSTFVYAQQRSGEPEFDGGSRFWQHPRPGIGDVKAFADARIAALKAGLQLTPDQEKNWAPFEQALRDVVKLRVERIQARESGEQPPPANFFDRLQRRADAMAQFGGALKHVAEAGGPLYQSLDDDRSVASRSLRTCCGRTTWPAAVGGAEVSPAATIAAAAAATSSAAVAALTR